MANNINTSGEARKIEEEFRLCKTYTMTKHSDINLIPSEKLTEFFIDHLKDKPIEIQPEVINPEHYPHILPPDNIHINSDIPTMSEVQVLRTRDLGVMLQTIEVSPSCLLAQKYSLQ